MTRRRAALLGGAVAVLLAGVFLLLRRRTAASATPVSGAGPAPVALPVLPTASALAADIVTAPPPPARTAAAGSTEPVEQPLPTWIRLGIVAAALLAFFAVSLVATKQV